MHGRPCTVRGYPRRQKLCTHIFCRRGYPRTVHGRPRTVHGHPCTVREHFVLVHIMFVHILSSCVNRALSSSLSSRLVACSKCLSLGRFLLGTEIRAPFEKSLSTQSGADEGIVTFQNSGRAILHKEISIYMTFSNDECAS